MNAAIANLYTGRWYPEGHFLEIKKAARKPYGFLEGKKGIVHNGEWGLAAIMRNLLEYSCDISRFKYDKPLLNEAWRTAATPCCLFLHSERLGLKLL